MLTICTTKLFLNYSGDMVCFRKTGHTHFNFITTFLSYVINFFTTTGVMSTDRNILDTL